MNPAPLTAAELEAWRAVVVAAERYLASRSPFHAGRLERLGRRAFKTRTPPPWEPAAMGFWRDLAQAAKALDVAALDRLTPEAAGRVAALMDAGVGRPPPYYLKD